MMAPCMFLMWIMTVNNIQGFVTDCVITYFSEAAHTPYDIASVGLYLQ